MFTWLDFEEDESSDAIPGKLILTILDEDGEEFATIVHRTSPHLDNEALMDLKRHNAQRIVAALNRKD